MLSQLPGYHSLVCLFFFFAMPSQKQVSGLISLNVAVINTGKQLCKVDA